MSAELERYISHGHHTVDGWLSDVAIELIVLLAHVQQHELSIHGPVCEIGVHHGRFLILLALLQARDAKVGAWDLFSQQDQNVDLSGSGDRALFERNLARHIGPLDERYVIQEVNSLELTAERVREQLNGRPVLFSIDGGHTKSIVLHDLKTAYHSIAVGGIVILDDYLHPVWPEVTEALHTYLPKADSLLPICSGGGKLFLVKDPQAQFRERLAAAVLRHYGFTGQKYQFQHSSKLDRHCRVMELFGHDVVVVLTSEQIGPVEMPDPRRRKNPMGLLSSLAKGVRNRLG